MKCDASLLALVNQSDDGRPKLNRGRHHYPRTCVTTLTHIRRRLTQNSENTAETVSMPQSSYVLRTTTCLPNELSTLLGPHQ